MAPFHGLESRTKGEGEHSSLFLLPDSDKRDQPPHCSMSWLPGWSLDPQSFVPQVASGRHSVTAMRKIANKACNHVLNELLLKMFLKNLHDLTLISCSVFSFQTPLHTPYTHTPHLHTQPVLPRRIHQLWWHFEILALAACDLSLEDVP